MSRSPINLYGSLKVAQERLIQANCRNVGSNYIILRPMCVFGNYDLGDRLVPKFITQAIKNQEIFYATDTVTNITYIDDMVQAMKLAIESDVVDETFNVSSGVMTDVKSLATDIKKYYDSLSEIDKLAFDIAEEQLETSFDVEKTIGFIKWNSSLH